jgi:monoamine oxidase
LGGYQPMFEYLAGRCRDAGVVIELSTTVRSIVWRRGSVELEAVTPDGRTRRFDARAALITVPAGVLRLKSGPAAVAFSPALPDYKVDALHYIEMGHVVKLGMSFTTPFWETVRHGKYRDGAFFRCDAEPFVYWTQWPVRGELLVAWAGGPGAIAMREMPTPEIVTRALRGLTDMFGETNRIHAEFEGASMHDWAADPYALGAYSYVAVGGGDARTVLSRPLDDTLFFAGEATADDGQSGTVNGAMHTGARAAREIAAVLR